MMTTRIGIVLLGLLASSLPSASSPRKVERVVSVAPAATEIVFAMGAGKKMVGVGTYDRWPPEIAALPRVGALIDPNLELIIQLKPDLALIDVGQHDLAQQLQSAGILKIGRAHV